MKTFKIITIAAVIACLITYTCVIIVYWGDWPVIGGYAAAISWAFIALLVTLNKKSNPDQ